MESQPFHADSIWYWWIIGNLHRVSLLKQVNAIKTAVNRTAKSTTKVLILKWELERIKKIDNRVHTYTFTGRHIQTHFMIVLWILKLVFSPHMMNLGHCKIINFHIFIFFDRIDSDVRNCSFYVRKQTKYMKKKERIKKNKMRKIFHAEESNDRKKNYWNCLSNSCNCLK